ncbi:hypothetical protein RUM43_004037, partial [Polyplax serrata]
FQLKIVIQKKALVQPAVTLFKLFIFLEERRGARKRPTNHSFERESSSSERATEREGKHEQEQEHATNCFKTTY